MNVLLLQIREIDVVNVNTLVKAPELFCDVCCMMFDQSDSSSFQVIAKTYMVSLATILEFFLLIFFVIIE